MTAEQSALLSEPIVRRVTRSPMPRVWLAIEFLGRSRVICAEYDHAPAEPATNYPGYLHVTRAWMGDYEITDLLERADFDALEEMIVDGRTS